MTNGHVVQPYQEGADGSFAAELLERAVASACAAELDGLSSARTDGADPRALREAGEPGRAGGRAVARSPSLQRQGLPRGGKFYSPPAYVVVGHGCRGGKEHGRDVAILKVEDKELPVARLASAQHRPASGTGALRDRVSRGGRVPRAAEPGHAIRALDHDRSRLGLQGGHRRTARHPDGRGHHSGQQRWPGLRRPGPDRRRGTFTSTQGDQVVQGFNFLVPVETIQEAARAAGVVPRATACSRGYGTTGWTSTSETSTTGPTGT